MTGPQWALAEVKRMRESRKETNIDVSEYLASFIATLPGRLIVTKHFGDARTGYKEHPMEQLRAAPVGRVCTEDKKVFVTVKAVTDWCKENGVTASQLREGMHRNQYLVLNSDGKPSRKIRIGAGTTIISSPATCYEFNYHKLFDGTALNIVHNNVKADTSA